MIIDYTYFIGKLRLPQTGNTDGRTVVEEFAEIYETEILKKAMGYDLWKAFTDGIEGSGDPDQRWEDLLDGVTFEYKGINLRFNGLDPEDKITPIANYCYYKYLEDSAADVTLAGVATGAVDNNTRVSPMQKMIDAWNAMVDMLLKMSSFIKLNEAIYPEFERKQQDPEVFRYKNSLDL